MIDQLYGIIVPTRTSDHTTPLGPAPLREMTTDRTAPIDPEPAAFKISPLKCGRKN